MIFCCNNDPTIHGRAICSMDLRNELKIPSGIIVSMSDIYISFSVNVVNPTIAIITVLSHKNDKEYKKEYKNAEYFHH